MNTKRAYNSTLRESKAERTRNRVLDAARDLFEAEGFALATIEGIAKAANVSAPTVYLLFQSKRGIVRALLDRAFPPEEVEARADHQLLQDTPEAGLRSIAKLAREMYDAERKEMSFFRGAFMLSPELKELEAERETKRYHRQEEAIKAYGAKKWLAPHLTVNQARDIFWAFSGRDLYRLMVVERGWSSDAYQTWLGDLLIKSLLLAK